MSRDAENAVCGAGRTLEERRSGFSGIKGLFVESFDRWNRHNGPRLGAALAYYSLLSLAPLVFVAVSICGLVFGDKAGQSRTIAQIEALVGPAGAIGVQALLQGAQHANHGLLATFVGIVMLLFGASSVVIELRDSLNTVWDVAVTPTTGLRGLVHMLRERLFSFVLVLAAGFLLLVSMLVNAGIAALGPLLNEWFPISEVALHLVSSLVSLVIIAILFGAIFKVMPDARLEWADVFAGALVSSFLFTLGKVLIALYLGKAGFASAYGAAASVVIFVAWVYYSAQIFFFGAELVRGFAERYGSHQTKLP